MHQKQIIAVFFSIVLLSGITGTFSPTPVDAESKKRWLVYVDTLPVWANIGNALQEAFDYWEKRDNIEFVVIGSGNADFSIQWVKDFGQKKIGHAVYNQWVEISLGDSLCGEQWNPFSEGYVKNLIIHEIGHAIGYNHESQLDSYMYPIIQDKHYGIIKYHQTIPKNWYWAFPTCVYSDPAYVSYNIESPDYKTKFDAYFVPTYQDAVDGGTGKDFPRYDSCTVENTFNVYSSPCQMAGGSYLLIKDVDRSITLDIEIKEGYDYNPKTFKVYAEPYSSTPSSTTSQKTAGKLDTFFQLTSPTLNADGTFRFFNEGDIVQFSGILFSKSSDGTVTPLAGETIRIVDYKKYKTTNDEYIPLIVKAVTNSKGEFSVPWNAIKHTGAVVKDENYYSVWTPIVHFDGNNNYYPEEKWAPQFFVIEKPNTETKSITGKYDAQLHVAKREYTLAEKGPQPVIISGIVYGKHDGDFVIVYVDGPGIYENHKALISKNSFSTSFYLTQDSMEGVYKVTGGFRDGDNDYAREITFEPTSFTVSKNTQNENLVSSPSLEQTPLSVNPVEELESTQVKTTSSIQSEVFVSSYTALLENGNSAIFTGYLYGLSGQNRVPIANAQIYLHDNSYDLKYPTEGPIITYTTTDSSGYFEFNWVVTQSGPKITDDNRWPLSASFSGSELWPSSYSTIKPNYYPKNDPDMDKARTLTHSLQKQIEQFESRIITTENSLSGLQYQNPEAQKKINDAWSVRWTAIQKLNEAREKWNIAYNDLIQYGKYKEALVLFEEIDSKTKGIDDDLNWISSAITDAENLQKQHKSQDFLAFAFNSGEGKTCIWFICW